MFADPHFMGNPKQVDRLCDLMMEHDLNMEFCALSQGRRHGSTS